MTGNRKRGLVLQERDKRLFQELSVMRIIDREQAKVVAGFRSTTRANRRLLTLTKHGLLKRFFLATVGGGKKAIYFLSPAGAAVVQVRPKGPRRQNDEIVTVDFFAYHQLGINDIYCALKYGPIPADGVRFVRWESFVRPIDSQASLMPDGYVEVSTPAKAIAAFLEFDLGHENLPRWKAKVQKYLRYAVSGDFQQTFKYPQFRVLVVANSERRLRALRRTVAAMTDKIFWFTTMDSIQTQGLWSLIWFRPQGDQGPVSLL